MKEMLYAVRCLKSNEEVNLLGSCFPVKGMSYERNVICSAVFEIK